MPGAPSNNAAVSVPGATPKRDNISDFLSSIRMENCTCQKGKFGVYEIQNADRALFMKIFDVRNTDQDSLTEEKQHLLEISEWLVTPQTLHLTQHSGRIYHVTTGYDNTLEYLLQKDNNIHTIRSFCKSILQKLTILSSLGHIHGALLKSNIVVSRSHFMFTDLYCNLSKKDQLKNYQATYSQFTSPEIRSNKSKNSHKSDIYSFGIIILDILQPTSLSKPEFKKGEITDEIISSQFDASVDKDLIVFLCHCVQENPVERFTSSQLLMLNWFRSIRSGYNNSQLKYEDPSLSNNTKNHINSLGPYIHQEKGPQSVNIIDDLRSLYPTLFSESKMDRKLSSWTQIINPDGKLFSKICQVRYSKYTKSLVLLSVLNEYLFDDNSIYSSICLVLLPYNNITKLEIHGDFFTNNFIVILSSFFQTITSLIRLSIASCPFDEFSLDIFCQNLKYISSLDRLNLSSNKLGENKLMEILNLKHLIKLKKLIIRENYINDEDLQYLVIQLKYIPQLSVLDLNGNLLTNIGFTSLLTSLKSFPIMKLAMSNNFLNISTKAIYINLCSLQKLSHLDLSHNKLTNLDQVQFKSLPNLHSIYLSYVANIQKREFVEFLKNLKYLNVLKRFAFDGNKVGDNGCQLISHIQTTLTGLIHLSLSNNGITSRGIQYLQDLFRCSTNLQELYLSYNPITNQGFNVLTEEIIKLRSMHTISLRSISVNNDILQQFIKYRYKFDKIEIFDLSENYFVNDKTMREIASICSSAIFTFPNAVNLSDDDPEKTDLL